MCLSRLFLVPLNQKFQKRWCAIHWGSLVRNGKFRASEWPIQNHRANFDQFTFNVDPSPSHRSIEVTGTRPLSMPPSTTISDATKVDLPAKSEWSPSSWQQKKAKQQPVYADPKKHAKALEKLETLPPLVTPSEVPSLTELR